MLGLWWQCSSAGVLCRVCCGTLPMRAVECGGAGHWRGGRTGGSGQEYRHCSRGAVLPLHQLRSLRLLQGEPRSPLQSQVYSSTVTDILVLFAIL